MNPPCMPGAPAVVAAASRRGRESGAGLRVLRETDRQSQRNRRGNPPPHPPSVLTNRRRQALPVCFERSSTGADGAISACTGWGADGWCDSALLAI